ncbi:MAG: hypothetical protein FWD64_03485 [Acidobacteriaceae bacterium]|nr:hypothetical protein [Acidobacteriaceae bacterium]
MKKLYIAIALVSLSLVAQAQFKVPKVPGISGGGDLTGAQSQLADQYTAANKDVLDGDARIYDALGLKDQAAQARAERAALDSGATVGNLQNQDKYRRENQPAVDAAFKNPPEMDEQAKASYKEGMIFLAKGLLKYAGMQSGVASFGNSLHSASPAMLPRLQLGAYIVKEFPHNARHLSQTLHDATAYAKAHDIAVPPDATNALGSMD